MITGKGLMVLEGIPCHFSTRVTSLSLLLSQGYSVPGSTSSDCSARLAQLGRVQQAHLLPISPFRTHLGPELVSSLEESQHVGPADSKLAPHQRKFLF